MHVRVVQAADRPLMATIGIKAFADDDMNSYISPNHATYPLSMRNHILKRMSSNYLKPGLQGLVCVDTPPATPQNPNPQEEIMGYAWYGRSGPPEDVDVKRWHGNSNGFMDIVNRFLVNVELWFDARVITNPAASATNRRVFHEAVARHSSDTFDAHIPSFIELASLAVHPNHQRKGVARSLLQWEIDKAHDERVPICLFSSNVGEGFYKSCGFAVITWFEFCIEVGLRDSKGMIHDKHQEWVRRIKDDEREELGHVMIAGKECEVDLVWTAKAKQFYESKKGK